MQKNYFLLLKKFKNTESAIRLTIDDCWIRMSFIILLFVFLQMLEALNLELTF